MVEPPVPTPAAREISPVGFSSISTLTSLSPGLEPSTTSASTVLNIFLALRLLTDLLDIIRTLNI